MENNVSLGAHTSIDFCPKVCPPFFSSRPVRQINPTLKNLLMFPGSIAIRCS